jgi:molecular chaperone GrpE
MRGNRDELSADDTADGLDVADPEPEEAPDGGGDDADGDESAVADEVDAFASASEPESADSTDADLDEELADVIDTEIHELAAERDQFKDIAQRLQADFENYRKRMSTQIAAEVERATGRLAAALLPVLDAAEAAYIQHPDEVGPLLNLMLSELRKHGLESIDLLDQPFDPNLADAVAHEPGEGGEPVVAEVLRSGYSWNGRTLRPAMVRTRD